ncbi:hypothetical protein HGRIS_000169 [Hohenbuehelia grisea]|uniref:Propionyl-CoA carboxylase beta chain, mitochondrial n=1 Tax=Hohenbuehelia grisea TaxID=104357 RepID=A0ABR3JQ97_9AGAR
MASESKKPRGEWEDKIDELRQQQKLIREPNLSDPGYIRQKQNNKLWVRERIDALLDKGSFVEVASIAGGPVYDEKTGELKSFVPANAVTGSGKIRGRKVCVNADDFSVRGGHADGGIGMKAVYGEMLARKYRVPLIRLLDGSSGGGSVALYLSMGAIYIPALGGTGQSMDTMAVVPVASALLGPVVGLAAAKTVLSHFSVMVKGLSQLFAAGPPVVKQATFEDLTKEQLGGVDVHAVNGTVDNVATSEQDAFEQIKTFLSYLPSSIFELPPIVSSSDPADRCEDFLASIIPKRRARPYDVRSLIRLVVDVADPSKVAGGEDNTTFWEMGATWGKSIVTGFARLSGYPVGVLSSDCYQGGGAVDALGSQKTTRFVNLCDHFGIPILNLVDQPGFAIGSIAERAATIRHGGAAMAALYNALIPMYTVIIRRAFGVAGGAFANPEEQGYRVAWPSGDWGSLPLEGGIEAAYKRQLDATNSPEERDKLYQQLLGQFDVVRDPLRTAHKFGVEEIIDPRETRPRACAWAAEMYERILPQLLTVRTTKYGIDLKPSSGRAYKL